MDNLLTMCCVCKKIKVNDNWVGEEYASYFVFVEKANNQISDGYCPECLKGFQEEIKLRKLVWDSI